MSSQSYHHGGHSLADILKEWRGRSLLWKQEHLAGMLERGEIVTDPELEPGWWLELMKTGSHVMRSYEEWVSIVWPDGTWRKAAEYRCHFRRPEPPPLPPPPPKTRPAKKSIDARAVDVLIRKRKWDQDRDLQRTKAFYRTFLGRGGIGINKFDETIWPQASAAPGVNPLKAGRPSKK